MGHERNNFALTSLTVIVCTGYFLCASQIHPPHLFLVNWETDPHIYIRDPLVTMGGTRRKSEGGRKARSGGYVSLAPALSHHWDRLRFSFSFPFVYLLKTSAPVWPISFTTTVSSLGSVHSPLPLLRPRSGDTVPLCFLAFCFSLIPPIPL